MFTMLAYHFLYQIKDIPQQEISCKWYPKKNVDAAITPASIYRSAPTIFSNFTGNPISENVEEGVSEFKNNNCDGVIAFGGGSALDVGKSIAFMSAGIGLLNKKSWARILSLIVCILSLFSIPFGTCLGIYGIYVLMKDETMELFK